MQFAYSNIRSNCRFSFVVDDFRPTHSFFLFFLIFFFLIFLNSFSLQRFHLLVMRIVIMLLGVIALLWTLGTFSSCSNSSSSSSGGGGSSREERGGGVVVDSGGSGFSLAQIKAFANSMLFFFFVLFFVFRFVFTLFFLNFFFLCVFSFFPIFKGPSDLHFEPYRNDCVRWHWYVFFFFSLDLLVSYLFIYLFIYLFNGTFVCCVPQQHKRFLQNKWGSTSHPCFTAKAKGFIYAGLFWWQELGFFFLFFLF